MPITKDVNNIITYEKRKSTWEDELTGVYPSLQLRIGGDGDVTKQLGFDTNDQAPNTTVILKGNASTTTNITVTLPATSGTLSYGGGGGSTPSFSTIQTPAGTSPVATSSTDVLTLVNGTNIAITGNAGTDSVTFALTGQVAVANGGTGASTAAAARVNLNVESRTTFSNANYTALATDKYIAQIGTLTGNRTVTLPLCSVVNPGFMLTIADESGTAGSGATQRILVSRSGSDTIDKSAASAFVMVQSGSITLVSDGVSNWTIVQVSPYIELQPTGSTMFNYHFTDGGLSSGKFTLVGKTIYAPTNQSTFVYGTAGVSMIGTNNTSYGYGVLPSLTIGSNNVGLGSNIMPLATEVGSCVAIGDDIMINNVDGSSNVGIGTNVMSGMTGAVAGNTNNIGIGISVMPGLTTGGFNTGIGAGIVSGNNATLHNSTLIGNSIAPSDNLNLSSSSAIGTNLIRGDGSTFDTCTLIGSGIGNDSAVTKTWSEILAIGGSLLPGAVTASKTTAIGSSIVTTPGSATVKDVFIGNAVFNAKGNIYTGSNNVAIGNAIVSNPAGPPTITNSVLIGDRVAVALENTTSQIVIGSLSGNAIAAGNDMIVLGTSTASGVVDGTNTITMGNGTLGACTTPVDSIAIGRNALSAATGVNSCVILGPTALDGAPGGALQDVIAIGTTGIGSDCDNTNNIVLIGKGCQPSSSGAANEFCSGGNDAGYTQYWWGYGGKPHGDLVGPIYFSVTPNSDGGGVGSDWIFQPGNAGSLGSGRFIVQTSGPSDPGVMSNSLIVDSNGNIEAPKLDNNGSATGQNQIRSGTYTPALTNVANLAASTAFECQWSQVGNVVTVSGKANVDPTLTATSTQLGISLPVTSDITGSEKCCGTAACPAVAGQVAAILGDSTNDRAQMQWIATDVTAQDMYFTFTYRIG